MSSASLANVSQLHAYLEGMAAMPVSFSFASRCSSSRTESRLDAIVGVDDRCACAGLTQRK